MKIKNQTTVQSVEEHAIDQETGEEIISSKKVIRNSSIKVKTYDEFIQVYLESLGTLDTIAKDSSAMRVLIYLWNKTPFIKDNDDCAFIVSSTWKALCSDDLGISPRTIGTAIKALEEHKFILPGKRKNVYSLNPKYFFKGNLETRAQIVSTVNISIEPSEDFQA